MPPSCNSIVLPARSAYEPLDTEADNADTHNGFKGKNNFILFVDENPAADPEQGEMEDEDQAESDH
jgi:hypothetical protein